MQEAACQPTSQQFITVSVLVKGTCRSHSKLLSSVTSLLRTDVQQFPGVQRASVRILARTDVDQVRASSVR
jgi:hypothetical protein